MPGSNRLRRRILNIGLLIVVILLALTTWHANHSQKIEGHALIPDLKISKIQQIKLTHRAGTPLVFVHDQDDWRINQPLSSRANQLLVRSLLDLPIKQHIHRYLAKGLNLDQLGLEPPQATIQYGQHHQISLGISNPVNHRRYALAGQYVYLVQDNLAGLASADALDWVSLTLLPPHARIKALDLPHLSIHALSAGRWVINPRPIHLSKKQITRLIRTWTMASAYRVTSLPLIKDRTTQNNGQAKNINIVLENGKRYQFTIISTHPELVLGRNKLGIAYHFPSALAKALLTIGKANKANILETKNKASDP